MIQNENNSEDFKISENLQNKIKNLTMALEDMAIENADLLRLLTQLTESAPICIWAKGLSGKYKFANSKFKEFLTTDSQFIITNKTDEDIDNLEINKNEEFDGLTEETAYFTFNKMTEISDDITIKNKKSFRFWETYKIRGVRKDFQIHKSPWYDERNEIIGIIGCGIDITERIKSREQFCNTLIEKFNSLRLDKLFENEIKMIREYCDRHKFVNGQQSYV